MANLPSLTLQGRCKSGVVGRHLVAIAGKRAKFTECENPCGYKGFRVDCQSLATAGKVEAAEHQSNCVVSNCPLVKNLSDGECLNLSYNRNEVYESESNPLQTESLLSQDNFNDLRGKLQQLEDGIVGELTRIRELRQP